MNKTKLKMNIKGIIKERLRLGLLEVKGDTHKFGCVMIIFNIPKKEWDNLQSMIDEEDIYTEEGDKSYGREDEPHATLLYGLHATNTDKEIEEISKGVKPIEIKLNKINIFENEKFDVLKFEIDGKTKTELSKINKEYVKLPHTTEYPNYEPHTTIAYLKSGRGKKYIQTLSKEKEINVISREISYSKADGTKIKFKLKDEK